ncbi:TPA: hypothetical protein HA246_06010 [Candidatus Woesearchaeota archaeon]|nr:hypothetical protein [Candidatus Woesearchaeota archaeon]
MTSYKTIDELAARYQDGSTLDDNLFDTFKPLIREKLSKFPKIRVFVPGSAPMRNPASSDVLNALYLSNGDEFYFVDPAYDAHARVIELDQLRKLGEVRIVKQDEKVLQASVYFDGKERTFYFISQDATLPLEELSSYEFYMTARRISNEEGIDDLTSPKNLEAAIAKLASNGLYLPDREIGFGILIQAEIGMKPEDLSDLATIFKNKLPAEYGLREISRRRSMADMLVKGAKDEEEPYTKIEVPGIGLYEKIR